MSELTVDGVITQVLEVQSGEGRNGPWRKGGFILETKGQYPKEIQMDVWGDNLDTIMFAEGMVVRASIDLQSREYNGKWYTDVKAWKILDLEHETKNMAADRPKEAPPTRDEEPWPTEAPPQTEPEDDLPF